MQLPSHVSLLTRILINLLRKRKDVLCLTVELLIPENTQTPEIPDYYDVDLDEQQAERSADTIDTLNRIYNSPSGRQH